VNAVGHMWPYAIPFYAVRIAEMRPILIVVAAMVAIGILVWKKPSHYVTWIAGSSRGRLF
jgi:hypothetical protein